VTKILCHSFYEIIKPKLEDTQLSFLPGRSTDYGFEKFWEHARDVPKTTCFAGREESYHWVLNENLKG